MEWLANGPALWRDPKARSCAELLNDSAAGFETAAAIYQDEILQAVKDYYKAQGKLAPPGDIKACKEIGQQYLAELKAAAEEAKKPVAPPKPVYGTPEFWKAYWAKKRAAQAQTTSK